MRKGNCKLDKIHRTYSKEENNLEINENQGEKPWNINCSAM